MPQPALEVSSQPLGTFLGVPLYVATKFGQEYTTKESNIFPQRMVRLNIN